MRLSALFVVFSWINLYAYLWTLMFFPAVREISGIEWTGIFFLVIALVNSISYSQDKTKNVD